MQSVSQMEVTLMPGLSMKDYINFFVESMILAMTVKCFPHNKPLTTSNLKNKLSLQGKHSELLTSVHK